MIDEAAMRAVCQQIHAVMIGSVFGEPGVDGLFSILETVRELYRHVEPGRVRESVIVFYPLPDASGILPPSTGEMCGALDLLGAKAVDGVLLELRADGRRYVHPPQSIPVADLARNAVVYEYRNSEERFFAGTECKSMIRLVPTAHSQFAVPTFFTLRQALREYSEAYVRSCGCPVLNDIWADENRLFLTSAPEKYMRRSLTHFLKVRLGASYEVRPEQVMDESHPVDIKVSFTPAKRLMIIEIKWMGDSLTEEGGGVTSHRDARAKAGAEQLAGYLDENRVQAPLHVSHGYYVIIDARRRALHPGATTISRENGLYYSDKEIEFDPEYHRIRVDFDPPYRMFAEPKHLP